MTPLSIHKKLSRLLLLPLVLFFFVKEAKAGNVIFSFSTITSTTNEPMDLFRVGTNLVTSSMSPSVYFALGFVDSGYNFVSQSRTNILAAIGTNYIGSLANVWANVGSGAANGGKATLSFNNGGNGFNTTNLGWQNKQLVAVISQGVDPVAGAITDSVNLAIVRGGTLSDGTLSTAWNSILASDGTPNPISQVLDVRSFNQILYGEYASSVGIVSGTGASTRYFDTITLIPEPTTASLTLVACAFFGIRRLVRRKPVANTSKTSKSSKSNAAFTVLGLMVVLTFTGVAQEVSTPVVGFMKLTLPAGKASLVAFPLNPAPLVSGTFTGKTGNTLNTSASLSSLPSTLINVSGEPLYYLEVMSGTYRGSLIDITSKGAGNLTVSDSSTLLGNESFQIKKYTTVADVFGKDNSAGLKGSDSISNADVIWIVSNGTWKQYFFYDDGAAGAIDPVQWQTVGSSTDMSDTRIDPDQGILIIRQAGSNKDVTITGQVKSTPSFVPFLAGAQIITNPYPVDKTLGTIGLRTGNSSTGLVEGDSLSTSDVVYKLENGVWKQYFIYNDGADGAIDPIQWQTIGSGADQSSVSISAGEALLVIRKASAFNWQPGLPSL